MEMARLGSSSTGLKAPKVRRISLQLNEEIKVKYFELLCEYESEDKVLAELRNHSYPPMKVLEICKTYDMELPVAYINERLGRSKAALEVFKKRFTRFIREIEKRLTIQRSADNMLVQEIVTKFYNRGPIDESDLYKKHEEVEPEIKAQLEKMERENKMVKDLGKNSDNSLEISYEWFYFLTTFLPLKKDGFNSMTIDIGAYSEQALRDKNEHATNVPPEVVVRFLVDTFDDITNKANVHQIVDEFEKEDTQLNVFESSRLCSRLVMHCKRQLANWENLSDCILQDTSFMNEKLMLKYVRRDCA